MTRAKSDRGITDRFLDWFLEKAIPWLINAIAIAFVLLFLYRLVGLFL